MRKDTLERLNNEFQKWCDGMNGVTPKKEGNELNRYKELFRSLPRRFKAMVELDLNRVPVGGGFILKTAYLGNDFIMDQVSLQVETINEPFEVIKGEDIKLLASARELRRLNQEHKRWSDEADRTERIVDSNQRQNNVATDLASQAQFKAKSLARSIR